MKWLNIKTVIICITIMTSCSENSALKKEYFYLTTEEKSWAIDTQQYDKLLFINDDQIKTQFALESDNYDFAWSGTAFLGINTLASYYERIHQRFTVDQYWSFSYSVVATEDLGGNFELNFLGWSIRIVLSDQQIFSIRKNSNTSNQSTYKSSYNEGNIKSKVTLLSNFQINKKSYAKILKIEYKDFTEDTLDTNLKELYWAQEVGPVQFTLQNGLTYRRIDLAQ